MTTPEFWKTEADLLFEHIFEALKEAIKDSLSADKAGDGELFSQAMANEQAVEWARQYAATLANQVNAVSQRLTFEAMADWMDRPGATIGELTEALKDKLAVNVSRAGTIAVTEVTRAYAEGNRIAYTNSGVEKWRWRTNRDDLVCTVCGPLNGKVKQIGESFGVFNNQPFTQPPAHPNCRCWVTPVVDEEAL